MFVLHLCRFILYLILIAAKNVVGFDLTEKRLLAHSTNPSSYFLFLFHTDRMGENMIKKYLDMTQIYFYLPSKTDCLKEIFW